MLSSAHSSQAYSCSAYHQFVNLKILTYKILKHAPWFEAAHGMTKCDQKALGGADRYMQFIAEHSHCICSAYGQPGRLPYFLEISLWRDFIQGLVWCSDNSRAARFWGGIYRDRHARTYVASIISLFVCTYNALSHMYIAVDPSPCGEISRAAFIGTSWQKYVARFQGWWDFKVQWDFEEIRYVTGCLLYNRIHNWASDWPTLYTLWPAVQLGRDLAILICNQPASLHNQTVVPMYNSPESTSPLHTQTGLKHNHSISTSSSMQHVCIDKLYLTIQGHLCAWAESTQ